MLFRKKKKPTETNFNGQGKRIHELKLQLISIGYAASEVDYMIHEAKKEPAALNGEQAATIEIIMEKQLVQWQKY